MAEEKKYFWLRLRKDFFKRHDIQIIESMKNGKEFILFYLKLMCESVDHEGNLKFSETIPYTEEMLSTITNTNIKIVREALKIFTSLGMMETKEDGTYFINGVQKMIGVAEQDEHTRESSRIRSQNYRERKKQKELNVTQNSCDENVMRHANVTQTSRDDNVIRHGKIEIEKEIETELETEIEIDKNIINYQKIVDMYNDTCVSFPKVTSLSDARKKCIRARFNKYSENDFLTMFQKAEQSSFLKGGNDRNWMANFDWMLKDSNMAKILDGNYDDRETKDRLHKSFDVLDNWLERRRENDGRTIFDNSQDD
jgi:predicted phage replisome organizer